jgi:subtilisin family serine protease
MARSELVERIDSNPRIVFDGPRPVSEGATIRDGRSVEWNVSAIGADIVWDLGVTGTGIVVGGQDTGYDWDHPALIGAYRGWDGFAAEHDYNWHDAIHAGGGSCGFDSAAPCDDHGHGTHTMGTIAGDDGSVNRVGVSPGATWIGCRNMDQGAGTPATYAECFQWFVAPTAVDGSDPDPSRAPQVINNSWLCPASEGCGHDTLRTVVENTRAAGIVVVVSAGNGGGACSTVSSPAAIYDASFSVGATDSFDAPATFSSRGPVTVDGSNRLKPDVTAPGVGIRSASRGGGYSSSNGTSMAGPHVAGLVALLLDARPDLVGRVEEVEQIIRGSAVPLTSDQDCGTTPGTDVPNNTFGHGRVDAGQMLLGDIDGDGAANLDDCLPTDPAQWAIPGDPRLLRMSKEGGGTLEWDPPGTPGSAAPTYDVVRTSAPDGFDGADCVVSSTTATGVVDGTDPPKALYYLVRAVNACGFAMGAGSSGAPRTAPQCP